MKYFLFILCSACQAYAASVNLAWDANTEPDIAGYKIHTSILPLGASDGPVQTVDVGDVTQYEVQGLAFGTRYFFAATAYNTSGLESGYSNTVNYMPMPPSDDKLEYTPRRDWGAKMVGGKFEASTGDDAWVLLATITSPASNAGNEITLPFGTLAQYKLFRYRDPDSNVAELSWWQAGVKLTGTQFGTPGAWAGLDTGIDKVFDSDPNTYWAAPIWDSTTHAGIDTR